MSRKDKPYLPLYVQDVLTDEKLIECSAQAHGVYLLLMCILHKQDKYGLLCLKQKYKQSESKYESFARMLARQMPFDLLTIKDSVQELAEEGVIVVEDDKLFQKRMVADGELSLLRADIGKTGGSKVTKQYGVSGFLYWMGDNELKNKIGVSVNVINRLYRLRSDLKLKKLQIIDTIEVPDMGSAEDEALLFFKDVRDGEWIVLKHEEMAEKFALLKANMQAKLKAKTKANSDIDIDIENDNENVERILKQIEELNSICIDFSQKTFFMYLVVEMAKIFVTQNPDYFFNKETDYSACLRIAYNIAEMKKWTRAEVVNGRMKETLKSWQTIVDFIKTDTWLCTRSLSDLGTIKEWQRLVLKMQTPKKNGTDKQQSSTDGSSFKPD